MHAAQIPPPPRLHKPHLVIHWIFFGFRSLIQKQILNLKKASHLFVELVETNPLMDGIKYLR